MAGRPAYPLIQALFFCFILLEISAIIFLSTIGYFLLRAADAAFGNCIFHIGYTESAVHKNMMRFKIFNSSLKFCASIHLVLFFAASAWFMPRGSVAGVIDQLDETFEFVFSTVPFKNFYLLNDFAVDMNAARLIAIFFVTALPGYVIGYLLFLRFFKKQIQ